MIIQFVAGPIALSTLICTAVAGEGQVGWHAQVTALLWLAGVLIWAGRELSRVFKAHLEAMEAQSEALLTLGRATEDLASELASRPCALNTELLEKFLRSKAKSAVTYALKDT